jgi:predicted AAA+ superfamily ATPase
MYERALLNVVVARMAEPRQFLQVLVGPRQVGKTTLVSQLAQRLGSAGVDVLFETADAADAIAPGWLDQVWQDARTRMALTKNPETLLCIDEVQRIDDWALAVKRNWDADTRSGIGLKVLLTGSSRLLLAEGLPESLFGRFELHHLGYWLFPEMKAAFGWTEEQFAWFGGYPGAAALISDEARFKSYVSAAVVDASLTRDILMLSRIEKPALLRNLLDLGITYSGQIVSFNKLLGQLVDAGNTTTLARYLTLVDQAGLLAGLPAFDAAIRSRQASPKYQVHTTALFSALQPLTLPQARQNSTLWGRVVENAVGAHLLGLAAADPLTRLSYWRRDNDEVDFVLSRGEQVVGIEVKSNPGGGHVQGLAAFERAFPQAATLLVGGSAMSWQEMLQTEAGTLFGIA